MPAITELGTSRGLARIGIGALTGTDGVLAAVFESLASSAWVNGVDAGIRLVDTGAGVVDRGVANDEVGTAGAGVGSVVTGFSPSPTLRFEVLDPTGSLCTATIRLSLSSPTLTFFHDSLK